MADFDPTRGTSDEHVSDDALPPADAPAIGAGRDVVAECVDGRTTAGTAAGDDQRPSGDAELDEGVWRGRHHRSRRGGSAAMDELTWQLSAHTGASRRGTVSLPPATTPWTSASSAPTGSAWPTCFAGRCSAARRHDPSRRTNDPRSVDEDDVGSPERDSRTPPAASLRSRSARTGAVRGTVERRFSTSGGTPDPVAVIAPPWVAVPPPGYGGTERVLDDLCRALVGQGHDVLLHATGDSTCPVTTSWTYEMAKGTEHASPAAELRHVIDGYDAARRWGADVVHDHTMSGPFYAERFPELTVVTTNHGPFDADLAPLYRASPSASRSSRSYITKRPAPGASRSRR